MSEESISAAKSLRFAHRCLTPGDVRSGRGARGRELCREAGEDPRLVERLALVRLAVDAHEAARPGVHGEAGPRGEVPVVALDQLVHGGEAPAGGDLPPLALERRRVARRVR